MMKFYYKILFVLLFLISLPSMAQNLVLNPDMESVNAGNLKCDWYTTPAQFASAIDNWTAPTDGSTDIFNNTLAQSCYSHTQSTHANSPGSQVPHSGNTFCNITVYGSGACTPYREYLQGELSTPMVPGQQYSIEFYVSFADNGSHATNNIGVYFTNSALDTNNSCVYNVTPHVNETSVITDSTNWVLLSFTFTPTQPYEYFTIGNFYDDASTNTVSMGGSKTTIRYFVDDVKIETASTPPTSDFNELKIPTVFTPNGDNINDYWEIKGIEAFDFVEISIFNRWGDNLFYFRGSGTEYSDPSNQWNGTGSGNDLPAGTYVFTVNLNKGDQIYKGTVSIIR